MNIAFIGLGIMGSGMAANLLKAGHTLSVYNRTPAKADALVAAGATRAATPAASVASAALVITVVAHPAAVEAVALGEDGFLPQMQAGAVWLNAATVHPNFARKMDTIAREHGVHYLDAPVAGSKPAAQNAELTFIVGGGAAALETARPAMEAMGQRILHIGDAGMGTAMKLIFNNLLAVSMAGFAEALNLGVSLGIPKQNLLNALVGSPITPPFMAGKKPMMETDDYTDTQFPLQWMQKDLHMVAEAAFDVNAPMPVSNAAKEAFQMAMMHGFAELDFSAIARLYTPTED